MRLRDLQRPLSCASRGLGRVVCGVRGWSGGARRGTGKLRDLQLPVCDCAPKCLRRAARTAAAELSSGSASSSLMSSSRPSSSN